MDKVCPVLIVLLVLLILYVCACLIALGTICKYSGSRRSKCGLCSSKDSGIDSRTLEDLV